MSVQTTVYPSRQVASQTVEVSAPSRREFLFYIWAASLVLFTGEVTAAILWFSYPRFSEGKFGGTFTLTPDEFPSTGGTPNLDASARVWLSHVDKGLLALYVVCTHLGCLYQWVGTNNRFECPCHGSKFELDGTYIEGPAPRSLDRFRMVVTFEDGSSMTTNNEGDPIALDDRPIANITIDTGARILRAERV